MSQFPPFQVFTHDRIVEQVAYEFISISGEMNVVLLHQSIPYPSARAATAAHHPEEVPHGAVVLSGKLNKGILHSRSVVVDRTLEFVVVVGNKDEHAMRVYSLDHVDELLVIVFELVALEIGGVGIVDANAKDHHVGGNNVQILLQQRAPEPRRGGCSIHARCPVANPRLIVKSHYATQFKGVAATQSLKLHCKRTTPSR